MRRKHARALARVVTAPTPASLDGRNVEAMLAALGARRTPERGSRIRVELDGIRAVFHRQHPEKKLDRGAVASPKRFLEQAGVTP